MPAYNEGFGVRRGAVSWDTSQDFGSFAPVRTFAKPRPTPSPRHVICNETSEKVLNDVALLLTENYIPPVGGYSAKTLKEAVLRSREDIRNGKVVNLEEMRAKHSRV